MGRLRADVRDAWRGLARARGLAVVVVLTLGGGLALAITVVAVARAYVGRALPYPAAERLYSLQWAAPDGPQPRGLETIDWSAASDVVEHAIAWDLDMFYLIGGNYPESAPGAWITKGFAEGLGIRPGLGRGFMPDDFEPGRPPVAVISDRLWRSRFGGDPAVLGRTFDAYVSDRPDEPEQFTIVGVLPASFWHLNVYTDVMAPLTAPTYPYIVRSRPGVGAEALSERLSSLVRAAGLGVPTGWRVLSVPTQRSYTAALGPLLGAVGVAAALVLLIACANVAVLLLVHTHRRRHEMAVRMALGGSRLHAMRLVALEALVLGAAATGIALVASTLLVDALAAFIEQPLGRRVPGGPSAFSVDAVGAAAGGVAGAIAMLACSLAPILLAGRTLEPAALVPSRVTTDAPAARKLRSGFLALQVALALALVVGALLVTESARRMLSVDLGLRTDVLVAGAGLREKTYPDAASRVAFYDGLLGEVAHLVPGGRVAVSDWWPLQQPRARATTVVGAVGDGQQVAPAVMAVSPGYFETLGIALRDGRAFSDGDRLGAAPVAIVSDSLARRLWPSARAVGRVLRLEPPPSDDTPGDRTTEVAIVGVVADVRQSAGDQELDDLYLSFLQNPNRFGQVFISGPSPARISVVALRKAAAVAGREAAMGTPRLLSDAVREAEARPLWLAGVLGAFAVAAAGLTLVGLYGVVAYAVRLREREVAVRMALGANAAAVTAQFVVEGWRILAAGLLFGALAALGLGRVLESQLFGVAARDPIVLALAALLLAGAGSLAMWWPARRAASLDPAALLKQE